jgi:excisionase family DNA binding protein
MADRNRKMAIANADAVAPQRRRNRIKSTSTKPITPGILEQRVAVRPREYSMLTGTPLPTVYKYIANGLLRANRIGGTIRIPVSEVR